MKNVNNQAKLAQYGSGTRNLAPEALFNLVYLVMMDEESHPIQLLHKISSTVTRKGRFFSFLKPASKGWGLAMARQLCLGHGDSIWADHAYDFQDEDPHLQKSWSILKNLSLEICAEYLVLLNNSQALSLFLKNHQKDESEVFRKICLGIGISLEEIFKKDPEKAQKVSEKIGRKLKDNNCWIALLYLSSASTYKKDGQRIASYFYDDTCKALKIVFKKDDFSWSQCFAFFKNHSGEEKVFNVLRMALYLNLHEMKKRNQTPDIFNFLVQSFFDLQACPLEKITVTVFNHLTPVFSEASYLIGKSVDLNTQMKLGAFCTHLDQSSIWLAEPFLMGLKSGLERPQSGEHKPYHLRVNL